MKIFTKLKKTNNKIEKKHEFYVLYEIWFHLK